MNEAMSASTSGSGSPRPIRSSTPISCTNAPAARSAAGALTPASLGVDTFSGPAPVSRPRRSAPPRPALHQRPFVLASVPATWKGAIVPAPPAGRRPEEVSVANFGDYQTGIYAEGMFGGKVPDVPTGLAGLESRASEVLSPEAAGYILPSAGSGATARANREAFDRWRIVPRML